MYGCVRVQGYMWRAFAEFESREGDPLVARHYYARAVNAEVCDDDVLPTHALPVLPFLGSDGSRYPSAGTQLTLFFLGSWQPYDGTTWSSWAELEQLLGNSERAAFYGRRGAMLTSARTVREKQIDANKPLARKWGRSQSRFSPWR